MTATLSSKCQVTIPKKIREQLGLKPGSKVDFVVRDHGVQFVSCDEQASRKAAVEMIRRTAGVLHKYAKNRQGRTDVQIEKDVALSLYYDDLRSRRS